jgi:thiamine-phosphate pyrophosphorylase
VAPDYIAVGPMFPTSTKPQDHIAGPDVLAAARKHTSLPLVAIGGIEESNVEQVLSAAPCAISVCGAVIAQTDVAAAASQLRAAMDRRVRGQGMAR